MEQKLERTRLYSGNAPGTGWECVHAIETDAAWWYLYRKDGTPNGWQNLKLVAGAQVANKANYWFAWNGKRTNNSKDWRSMEDHRPELQASVYSYLKQELDV